MAKKRDKPKAISKKHIKKAKAIKKEVAKFERSRPFSDVMRGLEMLDEEKKIEHKVEEVEKKEEAIEQKEAQIAKEEKKLEKDVQKVEGLEKKIDKEVSPKPLTTFSLRDLNKGIIGAFIGVVAHFGFIYGKAIADLITLPRAVLLLLFSYLLIVVLMYETGYREIKEKRLLRILPKRATLIFMTSVVVVMAIFFLFNMVNIRDPVGFFKQVAVTSVLASLGAGTADLLGKH